MGDPVRSAKFIGFAGKAPRFEPGDPIEWLFALARAGRLRVINLAGERGLYCWDQEEGFGEQVLEGESVFLDEQGRLSSAFLEKPEAKKAA